jgi:hypothetical protein
MRTIRASLLAGAAVIGLSGLAYAQSPQTHVLTVRLPGGGIEQIRYSGNTPPQVAIEPAADPIFASFDRIAAMMDRQAEAMFQETAALPAGSNFCERSTRVTVTGNGPPRIERHTSGNCGPAGGSTGSVSLPAARPAPHRPNAVMTRYEGARPFVRLASEQR